MEYNIREISNAVMIDTLDNIIKQESLKLKMDKSTGLLAMKSEVLKSPKPFKVNEIMVTQNITPFKNSKSYSPKHNYSCDRIIEIERLANLFTQSPSYFSINNNNSTDVVKRNQVLLKENMAAQKHNVCDKSDNVLLKNENNLNLISPDIKVRRNVRFGEYSPLNPANQANQANSQPFLGFGEYDDKRKKLLELQRKEYIEYLVKSKQEKNISELPKLDDYSCEEAFKTALIGDNNSEQFKLENTPLHNQPDSLQMAPPGEGIESCATDEEQKKETNRLKQELYRFELSKQIEEKKRLELERKQKEQKEDEAIDRAAREQEENIKKEFEKEAEKRTLAQLHKQLQQEKLKNEIMQKQKDLESKSWNDPAKTISRHAPKHIQIHHEFSEDSDDEVFHCPPADNTFDNVPLPTTRVRVPRKIVYDEETDTMRNRNVSCNTDKCESSHLNQKMSSPVKRPIKERNHVTFGRESSFDSNTHNSAPILSMNKSVVIDSPHKLALAGLYNSDHDDRTCEIIEPTETTYKNQVSQDILLGKNHKLLTDKHLLSNLGNIRKQLDIEHQRLKQQVRRSQ